MTVTFFPKNMFDEKYEMTVNNATFSLLAPLLQLSGHENEDGYVGSISYKVLRMRIQDVRNQLESQEGKQSDEATIPSESCLTITLGLSHTQIEQHFTTLETICTYAEEKNIPEIVWM